MYIFKLYINMFNFKLNVDMLLVKDYMYLISST